MRKLNKSERTREQSLQNLQSAYYYALYIDKQPRNDTRNAILNDPFYVYRYAKEIDQQPRGDTRNATLIDPEYAFLYAKFVDKQPRTDTKLAASNNLYWNQRYLQFEMEYHEKVR
jgi:hypothetical protein